MTTITNLPAAIEGLREIVDHAGVVMEFLNGEGPLEGVQFGDRHPTKRGAFWWRKELTSFATLLDALPIIDAQATRIAELEAEVARLRGPVTEYRRGFGPGDGDSAALNGGNHE